MEKIDYLQLAVIVTMTKTNGISCAADKLSEWTVRRNFTLSFHNFVPQHNQFW